MKICVIDSGYLFDAVLAQMPQVEFDETGETSLEALFAGEPRNIKSQVDYEKLALFSQHTSLVTWVGNMIELRYLGRQRTVTGFPLPRPTFWKAWSRVRGQINLRFDDVSCLEIEAGPLARFGPTDSAMFCIARRNQLAGHDVELLTGDDGLRKFARNEGIPEARWPPEGLV